MTPDATISSRPAARAASQPRPSVPEAPAFVATIATGAVAASARAALAPSSPQLADLPRVVARAASSVARA